MKKYIVWLYALNAIALLIVATVAIVLGYFVANPALHGGANFSRFRGLAIVLIIISVGLIMQRKWAAFLALGLSLWAGLYTLFNEFYRTPGGFSGTDLFRTLVPFGLALSLIFCIWGNRKRVNRPNCPK